MPLLSKRAQEEGKKSSSSGVDRYLNPGKLEDGSSVRFCLLEENALDFYEVWGALIEDSSKSRPYRFTDDPTPEDIEEAMATAAVWFGIRLDLAPHPNCPPTGVPPKR